MSHHLDTPLAAQTGQLYLDDLYVFPGQGSTVFVMDVNSNVNGLHSCRMRPIRSRQQGQLLGDLVDPVARAEQAEGADRQLVRAGGGEFR
jgi:hypothetical protein